MNILNATLARIKPVDPALLKAAQAKLDNKTKPLGSLGRIEEFGRRTAAISGSLTPVLAKKVIYTFAGDHGVVEEGVSAFPKEVTPQMVFNFLNGGAGVNVLARHAGAEVRVVDMGVDFDFGGSGLFRQRREESNGTFNEPVAFRVTFENQSRVGRNPGRSETGDVTAAGRNGFHVSRDRTVVDAE